MTTLNAWRVAKRRQLIPEGTIIDPWSWRGLAFAALYPARALRFYRFALAKWACLPGDVFEDFTMDVTYVVKGVKPRYVQAYAIANELLDHPDRIGQYGRRPLLAEQRVARRGGWPTMERWTSVDRSRAEAARRMVGAA